MLESEEWALDWTGLSHCWTGVQLGVIGMGGKKWQMADGKSNRKCNAQSQCAIRKSETRRVSEFAPGGGNDTKGAGTEKIFVEMKVKMAIHRNGISDD